MRTQRVTTGASDGPSGRRDALRPLGTISLILLMFLGCGREESAATATQTAAVVTPTLSEVTAERTDLMFRFRDEAGAWQQVVTLAEVPEAARAAVQVFDLARSPQERASGQFVQVFDLRAPAADGRFPGQLVPRDALEEALAAAALAARPKHAAVTMYSAAWCGVCRKARAFMEKEGIAFVEKDIEKDQAAAAELGVKSKRAGVPMGGVPVFDVGGQLMSGFDPETLVKAVRGG